MCSCVDRARTRIFHKEQPGMRVAVTVHPSEASPRKGIVNVKVFLLRRLFVDNARVNFAKMFHCLCKDDPLLQEQINELR